MIVGIGCDIVRIDRIEKIYQQYGEKFLIKILTSQEINDLIKFTFSYDMTVNYIAKRFAAKEAYVKALGTGFNKDISFTDLETHNNDRGKPLIRILKNKIDGHDNLLNYHNHLSISDDQPFAIAYVVIEKITR